MRALLMKAKAVAKEIFVDFLLIGGGGSSGGSVAGSGDVLTM